MRASIILKRTLISLSLALCFVTVGHASGASSGCQLAHSGSGSLLTSKARTVCFTAFVSNSNVLTWRYDLPEETLPYLLEIDVVAPPVQYSPVWIQVCSSTCKRTGSRTLPPNVTKAIRSAKSFRVLFKLSDQFAAAISSTGKGIGCCLDMEAPGSVTGS